MENTKTSDCSEHEKTGVTGQSPLCETSTYEVGGKTFIVEPRFKESGKETIGTILIKLMKADNVNA